MAHGHVVVTGDAIPASVRQIGQNFTTYLAYADPKQEIDERIADVTNGRKIWESKIALETLDIAYPELFPTGPGTVIGDNVGFTRAE